MWLEKRASSRVREKLAGECVHGSARAPSECRRGHLLDVGGELAHGFRVRQHGSGSVVQKAQVPNPQEPHEDRQVRGQGRGREVAVHAPRPVEHLGSVGGL
jgi:hypothetical protein